MEWQKHDNWNEEIFEPNENENDMYSSWEGANPEVSALTLQLRKSGQKKRKLYPKEAGGDNRGKSRKEWMKIQRERFLK